MFSFGLQRDTVSANPCAAIKAPGQENRCDRMLSPNDIRPSCAGLNDAPMAPGAMLALQLQLVTAQRKGEFVSTR